MLNGESMYIAAGLGHVGSDKHWCRVVAIPGVAVPDRILVGSVKVKHWKLSESNPLIRHTRLLRRCLMVEVAELVLTNPQAMLRNLELVRGMKILVGKKVLWVLRSLGL